MQRDSQPCAAAIHATLSNGSRVELISRKRGLPYRIRQTTHHERAGVARINSPSANPRTQSPPLHESSRDRFAVNHKWLRTKLNHIFFARVPRRKRRRAVTESRHIADLP